MKTPTITRRAFIAALVLAITPDPAEAMPVQFAKCPTVKQNGITYRLYRSFAIVTKCAPRKSVTIPDDIRVNGKRYTVDNIWNGAISRKTTRLVIKARHLDGIENRDIWHRRDLRIICKDEATRKWIAAGRK